MSTAAQYPPPLSDRLSVWARARTVGERGAVGALIEEDTLLSRDDVRRLLVVETGAGVFCDWARFEDRYRRELVLNSAEDAFLTYVIATAFPRVVPLWRLEELGDRRLGIILRAFTRLAGSDLIAIGTRTGTDG
ncbi:hypothetical protein GT204_19735 [Streptomyces sp. SID4919]|uniref:hypothetical protein n=1 Tax=unclassified Streptomyces TaxID=2593676 RepID=UPI000823B667|nr:MULTISPECIES: hypothetical protein [unclassified Streptomyces]MYY11080.1 hypothetical protein [Streptomyces sp. SID4919]SCK15160.1 hypothetical protein YW7DRAFT_00958 [Streptomyces sp. AmelKG-E11A]